MNNTIKTKIAALIFALITTQLAAAASVYDEPGKDEAGAARDASIARQANLLKSKKATEEAIEEMRKSGKRHPMDNSVELDRISKDLDAICYELERKRLDSGSAVFYTL